MKTDEQLKEEILKNAYELCFNPKTNIYSKSNFFYTYHDAAIKVIDLAREGYISKEEHEKQMTYSQNKSS